MPLPAVRSRRVATLRCSVIDGRRYVFRSKTRGAVAVQNQDRKSTRLNSSHSQISYAVFCLKKKKNRRTLIQRANTAVSYPESSFTLLHELGPYLPTPALIMHLTLDTLHTPLAQHTPPTLLK